MIFYYIYYNGFVISWGSSSELLGIYLVLKWDYKYHLNDTINEWWKLYYIILHTYIYIYIYIFFIFIIIDFSTSVKLGNGLRVSVSIAWTARPLRHLRRTALHSKDMLTNGSQLSAYFLSMPRKVGCPWPLVIYVK